MTDTLLSVTLISTNPNVRGGRPCLVGTGVRVSDVAMLKLFSDKTPDEIAEWFNEPLASVYAALAYYYEHRQALDEDIRAQDVTAQEFKANHIGSRHSLLSG